MDTWTAAKQRGNAEYNSFNGFKEPTKRGERIDWILARGQVAVESTEIVTFSESGQYPSDHFPVVAWLRVGDNSR